MEIRPANREDIRPVAELWVHSFPGERSVGERMHALETAGDAGGIETVHVAQDVSGLAGAMKMLPMRQFFGGAAVPMMGLAAVAVAPHARRRGVARELCEYALRSAVDAGQAVSVLYPFRPAFYAKFGWAMVGELQRWIFRPESLMPRDEGPVRLADDTDERAIRACYERAAARSNGMVERSRRAWRQHLDAPDAHAFVLDDGGVLAYLIARYGRSRSPQRRPLFVREIVADDDAAYRVMVGWIRRQSDLWRRIRYDASPDERFDQLLSDPRPPDHVDTRWLWAPTATVLRGPMLRIVNVRSAFELRREWGTDEPLRFTLHVEDALVAGNTGDHTVEFTGTATTVRPGAAGCDAGLALDIGTLAQLYAGELRVTDAVRLGRARVAGDVARIERFFRPRTAFRLLDEF